MWYGKEKRNKMLCGAGEARWAHNPKVGGSKPLGANGERNLVAVNIFHDILATTALGGLAQSF